MRKFKNFISKLYQYLTLGIIFYTQHTEETLKESSQIEVTAILDYVEKMMHDQDLTPNYKYEWETDKPLHLTAILQFLDAAYGYTIRKQVITKGMFGTKSYMIIELFSGDNLVYMSFDLTLHLPCTSKEFSLCTLLKDKPIAGIASQTKQCLENQNYASILATRYKTWAVNGYSIYADCYAPSDAESFVGALSLEMNEHVLTPVTVGDIQAELEKLEQTTNEEIEEELEKNIPNLGVITV